MKIKMEYSIFELILALYDSDCRMISAPFGEYCNIKPKLVIWRQLLFVIRSYNG